MRGKRRTIPFALWIASITFYALGLYYPILVTRSQSQILGITLKRQEIRLFDSIELFYNSNEMALAIIILAFTVILPIAKYIELAVRISKPPKQESTYSKLLQAIDKWSMLDVFVIALLLMNFKMNSSFIVMQLMSGTTYLAISIVLRMGVSLSWDLLSGKPRRMA